MFKKNMQPVEKQVNNPFSLEVHSIFYTIQGEGPFSGMPAVFVRLAGCNLQCPGCDTDYTSGRKKLHPNEILETVDAVAMGRTRLIVLTGGEPFRQKIDSFLLTAKLHNYSVQVETNGVIPPSAALSWRTTIDREGAGLYLVVSPKTQKIHSRVWANALAFKYVIHADHIGPDGLPSNALLHPCNAETVARPRPGADVIVQPMDCKNTVANLRNLDAAKRVAMQYGHRLQIQLHKLIEVE